jgi:hypothetical protein
MVRRLLLLSIAAFAAIVLTGCTLQRPADPLVLTGTDVPRLIGVAPAKVLAYRYYSGQWTQVPVQVDERAVVDLSKPLNKAATGKTFLAYTDANTWTGADPDPNLDANDELALMGTDGGIEAPAGSAPPNVVAGTGEKIKVTDPAGDPTPAYVYLFRQTGSLDPGAGRSYVNYTFSLNSGDYKTTYNLATGPNPENSTITTPYYSHHFSDRWTDDVLKDTAPNASGVDILDRHKDLFAPGVCGRSEDTFSAGPGAFIANKSGPVRAIRSYMGANSGTYTARTNVFYERRQDITTDLRVHSIPGIVDFFDYSPAATGMTYKSNVAPGGVTIDGVPENPAAGALDWETVDGPQGGLTIVHTTTTDIPGFASTSYYFDDKTPGTGSETQCTGDAFAYGSSGPWVNQTLPVTDPTLGTANKLQVTRTVFYDSPGKSDGPGHRAQVQQPLQPTVTAWP